MSQNSLEASVQRKIDQWLQDPYDQKTQDTLRLKIKNQEWADLAEAFYKDLEFGTGGLRGVLGVGSNRINSYTVGKATQGFSNYLKKCYPEQSIRVAISYDSRNQSKALAQVVANIFSANHFRVFIFEEMRPTPHLSYAIRQLGCHGGVMLTASHNPKEYNGYKAYWKDGGQLVAPHDQNVIREVNAITDMNDVLFEPIPTNIETLGKDMDTRYIQSIYPFALHPEAVQTQKNLKIVYSPLHGTGVTLVPQVLKTWGFEQVKVVAEQAVPDGNFPTVIFPNPEEAEAMSLAIQTAEQWEADLVLATDPDADRVGVAVKNTAGTFQLLNGNQIASLLVHYVLSSYHDKHRLSGRDYVVKTIVTSSLIDEIAKRFNTPCYNVLTGFKYIGELMTRKQGESTFLVGGEESYGYLIGDLVRDKDAVISCAFIAEMTAYYKNLGKNLYDALIDLYLKYGLYKEKLVSLTKEGKTGVEEIKAMMNRLRARTPTTLAGIAVRAVKDYQSGIAKDLRNDTEHPIDLPQSDVLQFITEEGDVISARPSGTEPKIKFYCSVKADLTDRSQFDKANKQLDSKIERIMAALLSTDNEYIL